MLPPNRAHGLLPVWLACAVLAAGCSSLPEPRYPTFVDHRFEAEYVVGDDGRLPFPATTRELVLRGIELTPPPLGEQFGADGQRWFVYERGTTVTVHGRLRAYGAPAGGAAGQLGRLLPGAEVRAPMPAQ